MSNGSIHIDDIQGDVSGVIKDSLGSIAAKAFNNYGTLIINNATENEQATLRKIQGVSTESGAIEKGTITREELSALQHDQPQGRG